MTLNIATAHELVIDIGNMPIAVRTECTEFAAMLHARYGGFVSAAGPPVFELNIELLPPGAVTDADDVRVLREGERWVMERGDFRAEWEPEQQRGWVRQSANPYAIDAVLRILHSLVLAREGGMLVHAASAVRNGKAFVFSGVSEAGKTTISRLAPPEVTLLTDEISYVRLNGSGYIAYGTPFAGELAKIGENVRAPLAAVYLLQKGPANKIEDMDEGDAVRALLRNVLFFAADPDLVEMVFDSVCALVRHVPVQRLTFFPDARVWELIG